MVLLGKWKPEGCQNGVSEFSSGVSSGPLWQWRGFWSTSPFIEWGGLGTLSHFVVHIDTYVLCHHHRYPPLVYTAHQIENSLTHYAIRYYYQTRNTAVIVRNLRTFRPQSHLIAIRAGNWGRTTIVRHAVTSARWSIEFAAAESADDHGSALSDGAVPAPHSFGVGSLSGLKREISCVRAHCRMCCSKRNCCSRVTFCASNKGKLMRVPF